MMQQSPLDFLSLKVTPEGGNGALCGKESKSYPTEFWFILSSTAKFAVHKGP